MCPSFSRFHPSGTDGGRRRAADRLYRHRRQHGRTCPQPFFIAVRTKESDMCASFRATAWICACQATDRDLESSRTMKRA